MSNRMLIGNKSSVGHGLFVSKPGEDVLTSGETELLFSSNFASFQFIQTGVITVLKSEPTSVVFPNIGYKPLILFYNPPHIGTYAGYQQCDESRIVIRYPTSSSFSMHIAPGGGLDNDVTDFSRATSTITTYYAVTRLKADG